MLATKLERLRHGRPFTSMNKAGIDGSFRGKGEELGLLSTQKEAATTGARRKRGQYPQYPACTEGLRSRTAALPDDACQPKNERYCASIIGVRLARKEL